MARLARNSKGRNKCCELLFQSTSRPSKSSSQPDRSSEDPQREDASAAIGVGTGLMGGDIEDAAIARYALSRTPKDPNSSDARDLGSAIGMQNIDPPF